VDDADRADVRTHHSTYLNLPVEWLGQPFVDEAEALKATNEAAYRHEYLGEAIGYGGEVFERVSLERLSDETLAGFDNIRNGIDWGFAVDPLAFVRAHYDKTRKVVYVFDELVATNLTDDEAAKLIKARGIDGRNLITADCADPKSIENWRRLGFQIRGCTKFPGSLGHGVKFLQGLTLIVIDPVRCPVAAREFPNYGLKRDANGVYQAVINQVNDHTIDALRYALDTEIAAHREAQTGFVGAR
jgi:phage terminase large subunit